MTGLLGFLAVAGAADYFVSPAGDDANDGLTLERPLRTIQAGVDRLAPGDTLHLRAGVYRELVVFPNSGTAAAPIVVRPYGGEEVTVTGCDPVEGWTLDDAERGIWKAPMPWTLGMGRNQVFAGGELRIEARHPNAPEENLEMYVAGLSPLWPTFAHLSIEDPKENPGRIVGKALEGFPENHWKGACYYGVHYEGWAAQTGIVESSKDGEIIVSDRTRTWWFGSAYGGNYKPELGRGMLVGHRNALDQPGEWHWEEGFLHLMTENGERPEAVEAKRRQLAFDLSGREHIHLQGLNIHAASLRLDGSVHCRVDRCRMTYISHYTRHYDIGQIETGKNTIKSGETGIFVSGRHNVFTNCSVRFSAGSGFYLRGYNHTIHNCLIDEVSYTSHYLNAITDAVSDFNDYESFLVGGHIITYNTMRNAGRHFFNFYGNGTSTNSRDRAPMDYMATLFAHNHLYNGMLQTKDAGFLTGYYSSGGTLNKLNSQVAYNVMHDCYDLAAMRWGVLGIVYLDAGTCNVDLYRNLLWAAPGSLQRGLWFNTMCVDINAYDNVFHPEFERTSAELTPADFPLGQPFRFGHDFSQPPPLPVWPQLDRLPISFPARSIADGESLSLGVVDFGGEWQSAVLRFASGVQALNTDRANRARPRHTKTTDPLVMEVSYNDGLAEGIRRQWTFMYNINPGNWIRFNQVPLGEGYRRFRVIYGNDNPAPRRMEVRLDQVDGPLVGTIALPQTDQPQNRRIQIYAEATGEISPEATGTRDVFLVFQADDATLVGEFEYFRFEQYRGAIPLAPNEAKLELRLDRPDGEKIGEFHPRPTGGEDRIGEFVAKLEPASGRRELFLVARATLAGILGTLDGIRLERASQPIDWSGVGEPPRQEQGRFVFPEPTNRPQAKPNDIYGKKAGPAPLSRPLGIASAPRLATPPTVDGTLAEWPVDDPLRTLRLAESFDGRPTAGPPSQAWIGYDDEALYIAARHPVNNAATLRASDHQWGSADGMEIAIQNAPGPILTLYGYPDGHFASMDYGGATAATIARLQQDVTYAAVVGENEWRAEWRIPFAACSFTPAEAPLLLFNIGVRKTVPESWVVWRGTGGANYRVGEAGMLVLRDVFLTSWQPPAEGLAVWFDAADRESVETDAEGKVARWRDKSGQQRDAVQTNPAHRPRLDAEGLQGLPALRFHEQDKTRLELPDLADGKITATIFAVYTNPVPGSQVNHDPRIFTASDGKEYDYLIGLAATIPGLETGGPRQSIHVFRDRWAKQARIGCFSPNPQTFLTGHIAEILVYTRELDPGEQTRIRAYLGTKWRLP